MPRQLISKKKKPVPTIRTDVKFLYFWVMVSLVLTGFSTGVMLYLLNYSIIYVR